MSAPDWCPPDVWAEAARIFFCSEAKNDGSQIARAILAERKRCVEAVTALPGMGDTDCCGGFERCRDDAIDAIRGVTLS